jgi:hypothetical protein
MTGLMPPSGSKPSATAVRDRRRAPWRSPMRILLAAVALVAVTALPASASVIPPEPTVTSATLNGATVDLSGVIQALADSCGADEGPHVGCGAFFELQGPVATIQGHDLFWTDAAGPFAVSDAIDLASFNNVTAGTYTPVLVAFNKSGQSFTSPAGPPIVIGAPGAQRRARLAISGLPVGCVRQAFALQVRITDPARVTHAQVLLDGRTIRVSSQSAFRVRVAVRRISAGRHAVTVSVQDAAHHRLRRTLHFERCH